MKIARAEPGPMALLTLLFVGSAACHAPRASTSGAGPDAVATCPPRGVPGGDACTAALQPGSDRACTFEFGGAARSFLVYAPPSYDPCRETPLVVDAHGATETAEQHAGLAPFRAWPSGLGSGFRLLADREGFLVVTPQGVDNRWSEKDVDFLFEVERRVTAIANVDERRVFLTGISNGGALAYATMCRDRGVFRAFAPISGQSQLVGCEATRPAALVAFHAPGDAIIPFDGGRESAAAWAERQHCRRGPRPSRRFGGPEGASGDLCLASGADGGPPFRLAPCVPTADVSTCEAWEACDGGATVEFCTISGAKQPVGGHVLYFNDTKLSLAAAAWEFFRRL